MRLDLKYGSDFASDVPTSDIWRVVDRFSVDTP